MIDGNCRRRGWPAAQVFCALLLSFAVASPAAVAAVYPLKNSANGRYLVDQNNVPYLITGDSPQALIVNLSEAEAETFFADREAHGFNTVWINLLCNTYTGGRADGSLLDGTLPFTGTIPSTSSYDLSETNEAYFAHVDRILNLAAQHGLQVLLDPIETGGWLNTLLDNGTNTCRAYGQYLGNRYQNFANILWMSGNDFHGWRDANNDVVAQAVALGIKDTDTNHIQTLELDAYFSGSLDDTNWAPIITLNATYTYFPTYAQLLVDYNRTNFLPNFMVEANYEFEHNSGDEGTPAVLRRQEYWTLLSGATGQLYGNHYTWQFISGWQTNLNTSGTIQFGYVKALFESRRWYDLIPDQNHTVVTAGYGTFTSGGALVDSDYATAAQTADGALVMVYLPTIRTITVDMSKLSGPVTAQWYDPSSGTDVAIPGSPFANSGSQDFTPMGNNADGDGDWVLVLESASDTTAPSLTITQPSDFQEFTNSPINVTGTASDAGGITSVTVNGTAATLTGSNWSGQVAVSIGTNLLTVIATDASPSANSTTNTVHVIFQPPPSAFALVSPIDGSSNLSLPPVLTWTPSTSDAIFSVQVAATTDFASPVFTQDGLLTTSTPVTIGLINGVTYFWRVTATNAGGSTSATNAPFRFATVPAPPVIICPPDVTAQCASQVPPPDFAGGSVTDGWPGATVSWTGDLTNDVSCPNRFTIQRTYTVTDANGNTASCIQIITVNDTTAPMITGPANVTTVTDAGKSYASGVVLGNAIAVASCGDNPTVVNNAPSQYPKGTNTVVWTATDSCNNSSTGTQLVIVVDNQPAPIVDTWEVSMMGVPRATCDLRFAADSTVSGYGVEESLCGAFTVTGTWSEDTRGNMSATFNQSFAESNCHHVASIDGTFTAKPSKNRKVNAIARDSLRAFRWKAARDPSLPVLIAGWRGALKVKKSKTEEIYDLTPADNKPGLYEIQGQSADATYTLTGALIVTSRNRVTASIVRQLPTGPVTSFYTGKVNPRKQTLSLKGVDATGAKHRISAVSQ